MKMIAAICLSSLVALLPACIQTGAEAPMSPPVPESGTKCGYQAEIWVCSYKDFSDRPSGYYTPSKAIPSTKKIYRGCRNECVLGYHPVTGGCMGYGVIFDERPNHANDIVVSGGRRAWCGTQASHASEYFTLP